MRVLSFKSDSKAATATSTSFISELVVESAESLVNDVKVDVASEKPVDYINRHAPQSTFGNA